MGSLRHPAFLLRVWLNTHSAAKLHVINCEDDSPAFSCAPSIPEHPPASTQAPLSSFLQNKNTFAKTMGAHGGVRASAGYGMEWEHEVRTQGETIRAVSSARANRGGLIDFALPWLGYASCAMFPEIGIRTSGSMRAGCPSSV